MKTSLRDPHETTNFEAYVEQYCAERELASRLRDARPDDRRRLYSVVYDEFYRRFPQPIGSGQDEVVRQMAFLRRFLRRGLTFVEIGPGDCSLSFAVAPFVSTVYAVDVSEEFIRTGNRPPNFQFVPWDGMRLPLGQASADLVYSHQVIEHLHPDDGLLHLQLIQEILIPEGQYICLTPNRLNGPHDISKHFDSVASGLHLKEYTTTELAKMFTMAGFTNIRAYCGGRGLYIGVPITLLRIMETFLARLRPPLRRTLGNSRLCRALLGIRLVGQKPGGISK